MRAAASREIPHLVFVAALSAAAAASAAAGCDERKPKPGGDTTSPDAGATPATSRGLVNAKLGCVPAAVGGHTVLDRIGSTTCAAAGGSGLVVTWRRTEATVEAARVALGGDAKVAGPVASVSHAGPTGDAGAPRMTWAAAGIAQNRPAAIAYSVRRADEASCEEPSLIVGSDAAPSSFSAEVCKAPTAFAAALRGDLGVAVLDGPTPGAKPPRAPGLDAIVLADGKTKSVRLEDAARGADAGAGGARAHDAGAGGAAGESGAAGVSRAVAAAAGGSWVAAAWVVDAGGAHELRVAGLDRTGARTSPKVLTIDKGVHGAPALAFEGDVLHVVWSARESEGATSRLRWTKWDGKGPIAPAQTLSTGSTPAAAPAFVVGAGGRFAIAWEDGPEGATAVKAGQSRVNILKAVLAAATVSAPRVKGRAPAVAIDADKATVVWQEIGSAASETHATQLICME